jgi:hypothetical protein
MIPPIRVQRSRRAYRPEKRLAQGTAFRDYKHLRARQAARTWRALVRETKASSSSAERMIELRFGTDQKEQA